MALVTTTHVALPHRLITNDVHPVAQIVHSQLAHITLQQVGLHSVAVTEFAVENGVAVSG